VDPCADGGVDVAFAGDFAGVDQLITDWLPEIEVEVCMTKFRLR
jgi:hypothetical protein